jgi:hypothetical protein
MADPVLAALTALDPDRLTPRDALAAIYKLRAMLPVATQDE